jgi:hypothetical protein
MADYAQASGRHMELGQARQQVEAQKQAMAQMQSELQQKDIDLQARLRELTARERALEKREAQRLQRDAEREKHEADARALSRSQSLELQAAEDRLRILEAQIDARQAALVVYIRPHVCVCPQCPQCPQCPVLWRAREQDALNNSSAGTPCASLVCWKAKGLACLHTGCTTWVVAWQKASLCAR